MAPGARAEIPAAVHEPLLPHWVFALGRLLGFTLLAGLAVAILGGLVLLPEYVRWCDDKYAYDLQAARTADLQSLVDAHERLFVGIKEDPVLIKRLAMSNCGLLPRNETMAGQIAPDSLPPGVIPPTLHPRPVRADNLLTHAAARIENAGTRRGLFLVTAGLMLAAMFLFAPPQRYKGHRTKAEG